MKRLLNLFLLLTMFGVNAMAGYGVWIAGIEITAANAHDVFGDGTVSVNDRDGLYEITLRNANIVSSSTVKKGLIYSKEDVDIFVVGNNKIESQGNINAAIYGEKKVRIYGRGTSPSLDVKGQLNGISAHSIDIWGVSLKSEGINDRGIRGFWGSPDSYLKIDVDNSPKQIIKIKGGIDNFAGISLGNFAKMKADVDLCIYDYGVMTPDFCIVTNDSRREVYRDEIEFSCGLTERVLFYDSGTGEPNGPRDSFTETLGSGTVTYDKDSKTFTLDNVGSYGARWIIKSYVDGLTVRLNGTNALTLEAYGDTKVIGDGINETYVVNGFRSMVTYKDVNISLEDVVIREEAMPLFLLQQNPDFPENVINLKLKNCDIDVRTSYGPLVKPIVFENCKFTGYSVDPVFDADKGTYVDADGKVLKHYVIKPCSNGIDELREDKNIDYAPAYDLTGRKVNSSFRGIAIKEGKKVIMK